MNARLNPIAARFNAPAVSVLGVLTLSLHGGALRGGWRFDDPMILKYVTELPLAAFFFSPAEMKSFGIVSFTPWLFLDYWVNFGLFGLDATGFYAHNLVAVWAAAALTFLLLRPFAGPFWGFVAAALFLLGAPTAVVSQQLMSRHYADGLVFAILAIQLHLHANESNSTLRKYLSGGCYLLALLNKEIFLPLPFVLFFLSQGAMARRLLAVGPFVLIAAAYGGWRAVMLSQWVGGYTGGFDQIMSMPASLFTLTGLFFGNGWPAAMGAALTGVAAIVLWIRVRRALPVVLAALAALALPFAAVTASSDVLHLRYALLPWWAWCLLCSLSLASLSRANSEPSIGARHPVRNRVITGALAVMVFIVPAVVGREASIAHETKAAEFDVQGAFLWQHDHHLGYVPYGAVAVWASFQYSISDLKQRFRGATTPVVVPFVESASLFHVGPVQTYEPRCRCMKTIAAAAIPTDAPDSSYDPAMPMSVWLDRSANGLRWRLDPLDASCFLVFSKRSFSVSIPCTGAVGYALPQDMHGPFRFLARMEKGVWGTSPLLTFPQEGQTVEWRRH